MNPNDVSGEDDDDSDTELHTHRVSGARTATGKDGHVGEGDEEDGGGGEVDGDEDEDEDGDGDGDGDGEVDEEEEARSESRKALRHNNEEYSGDDDEEAEDEEDDDDDDEMPAMENCNRLVEDEGVRRAEIHTKAKTKTKNNTLEKFLTKPRDVPCEKVKEREVPSHSSKKGYGKSTNGGGKGVQLIDTPVAARKTKPQGSTFNPHDCNSSEGGDDDDEMALTLPAKRQLSLPAPDVMQEYTDKCASTVNTTKSVGGEAPDTTSNVDPGVHEYSYVVKNEKTNKFWEVSAAAFVYAPKPDPKTCKELSLADITVAGKEGRIDAHTKLCDDEKAWVNDSAIIMRIATDGVAGGTGPCMNWFMLAVPYTMNVNMTKDMMTKLNINNVPGHAHKPILGLWPLDQTLVQRAYKDSNSKWPAAYNPNTNPSYKYKVPTKLEEQVKCDPNFTLVGPLERASRARKRIGHLCHRCVSR